MSTSDLTVIASAAARVLCAGIGALAIQPVLSDPQVFGALTLCAEAVAVMGVVVMAGWSRHKLLEWSSQRPVMPVPSQVYATMSAMPPQLQQTAAQLQADERWTEPTDDRGRWLNAVQRFCVIGSTRGSFGWHAMKHHTDRPGWDTITEVLSDCRVIRMGSGRRPTRYAEGWDSPRVRVALKRGWLDLPTPEHIPFVTW